MNQKDILVKILFIFILIICLGCDLSKIDYEEYEMVHRELDAHIRIIEKVKEIMGFNTCGVYRRTITPTAIFTAIDPDKAMFEGGVRNGDLIQITHSKFYELIVFNQENEITIPVKRDKNKLNIKVLVPYLDLQDDPTELHWPFEKHKE